MKISLRQIRALVTLGLIGLAAAALLAGVNHLVEDRIALNVDRYELRILEQLVSPENYDNELARDRATRMIPGFARPAVIYRARKDGSPVAALIDVTTGEGYSGDIRLLIGIDPQGSLLGVRVLEHRETPGVGDRVDHRRSDWLEQFTGRSLGNPDADQWRPDRREGRFDTLSNATITSSAVTDSLRRVLEWFEADPQRPFTLEADPR